MSEVVLAWADIRSYDRVWVGPVLEGMTRLYAVFHENPATFVSMWYSWPDGYWCVAVLKEVSRRESDEAARARIAQVIRTVFTSPDMMVEQLSEWTLQADGAWGEPDGSSFWRATWSVCRTPPGSRE